MAKELLHSPLFLMNGLCCVKFNRFNCFFRIPFLDHLGNEQFVETLIIKEIPHVHLVINHRYIFNVQIDREINTLFWLLWNSMAGCKKKLFTQEVSLSLSLTHTHTHTHTHTQHDQTTCMYKMKMFYTFSISGCCSKCNKHDVLCII